jgi:hypothetical protein
LVLYNDMKEIKDQYETKLFGRYLLKYLFDKNKTEDSKEMEVESVNEIDYENFKKAINNAQMELD